MAGPKPNIQETLAAIYKSLEAGAFERAETIARHLQQAYPRRADVNDALGQVLLAAGLFDEAETYFRRAVEGEKNNPDYLGNLGRALRSMGRVTEAEPLLMRALAIAPRNFSTAWQLGKFCLDTGQGRRAIEFFGKAQTQAPPRAREAIRLDLIEALVGLGETEQAKTEIERGLSSGYYAPQLIAQLAALSRADAGGEVYRVIEEQLQRRDLLAKDRRVLLLSKGTILERGGDYDAAYDAIAQAKRTTASATDIEGFGRNAGLRVATFSQNMIESLGRLYGTPGNRYVFVVGLPRTGTTLVEQIISRHSEAGGMGELETMTYVAAQLRGVGPFSALGERLAAMGPAKVKALAAIYAGVAEHLAPGKKCVIDKMPHNFRHIGEIAILFPEARFIHCMRHPADSFISAFQNDMAPSHGYSYAPENYAAYYAHYMKLMDHWKKVLPGRFFDVSYETLVTKPRETIESLLSFLGLPWEEACLSPHEGKDTVRTFSNVQIRSPINAKSIGRWKPYAKYLAALTSAS
ncbi:tetratricopeptide repeat-containing sulfotransferase family protein [Aestuariivirga sp.]|uniref:tetratricopeptide repeat-containing sulfotransferase family protein n=1 Tax=Aestuariivirga sp. TaxID=2650926 RepID=UPI0039E26063